MGNHDVPYGYTRKLGKVPLDTAIQRVTEGLKREGFGILTRIDVHDVLKAKLGVDFRAYTILGACSPKLAHQALTMDLGVGLVLPCNVVVFAGDGGEMVVQITKPEAMLAVVGNRGLDPLAQEADERLRRALDTM